MSHVIDYFTGYLHIAVSGDFVERFINMCSYHEIEIWNLCSTKSGYEMNIFLSDFRKLKPFIKKTKSKVIIKKREGFPFFLYKNRKRTLFLIGALLCIFLLYASTFYLWGIEFEGNLSCTQEMLLEQLTAESVLVGMRKEKIDCAKITHCLREKFDNIIWASAYVSGTKLMIHIKENNEQLEVESEAVGKDIVAECDGIITEIITRNGTPLVHIGDEVKVGDLLVSGKIEIKNDAEEVIEEKNVTPDATITAQVNINYYDEMDRNYTEKVYKENVRHELLIETAQHLYVFFHKDHQSKNLTSTHKMITIMKDKKIGVKTIREYKNLAKKYDKNDCQNILSQQFVKFCSELEKKGVQILENDVKIYTESNRAFAKGNVTVCKKIGVKQ